MAPKKFIKNNGINVLNPEYLDWKKNGGAKAAPTKREQPIDKMVVTIHVLEAKNLAAVDRKLFSKKKSSDPYVSVVLSCTPTVIFPGQKSGVQKIKLGKTSTMKKNLNPKWNHSFTAAIPYSRKNETLHLLFQIFDEDKFSEDDSLGVVTLGPLKWQDTTGSASWYEIPQNSAKEVSGHLNVSVRTEVRRIQGLKPYC